MSIALPSDVVSIDTIALTAPKCSYNGGHCFGGDNGGLQRVWTLDDTQETVLKKEVYIRCQHCLNYAFESEETDTP